MPNQNVLDQFQAAVSEAQAIAAESPDDNQAQSLLLALNHSLVSDILQQKMEEQVPFLGVDFPHSLEPDLMAVSFKFGSKLGSLTLKPDPLLVFIDLNQNAVVDVLSSASASSPFKSKVMA
mgnify:CR=1 FL=1